MSGYKLTGEGIKGKDIAAFAILPNICLTVSALMDKLFPAIPTTNKKITQYITPKTAAYIFTLVIDSVTIFTVTLLIPAHSRTRQPCSRHSMTSPLTNFRQTLATLSPLSTRRSSRRPALEAVP